MFETYAGQSVERSELLSAMANALEDVAPRNDVRMAKLLQEKYSTLVTKDIVDPCKSDRYLMASLATMGAWSPYV